MFIEITLNMQYGMEVMGGCGSAALPPLHPQYTNKILIDYSVNILNGWAGVAVLAHLHSFHTTLLEYPLDTQ